MTFILKQYTMKIPVMVRGDRQSFQIKNHLEKRLSARETLPTIASLSDFFIISFKNMGQRRMISNRIANSSKFLQMPQEAQLFYFHLIIRADDDGIVECYPIIKLLGVSPDAIKVLLVKDYIRQLNEDQVMVITDWQEHNTIRADRKVDSIYIELLLNKYPELPITVAKPRSDVKDNSSRIKYGQLVDSPRTAEDKISKDNIYIADKSAKEESNKQEIKITDLYEKMGIKKSTRNVSQWQDEASNAVKYFVDGQSKASSVFKCFKCNQQKARIAFSDCKELGKNSVMYFLKVYNEIKKV